MRIPDFRSQSVISFPPTFRGSKMRVVDDYESLLNELDLILERAHDSFSNVIKVRIVSVPHVFVCKKN